MSLSTFLSHPTLSDCVVALVCIPSRWRPQSKVNAHVILDLSLTPHVMKTLATLPAWSGTLDFSYATWPLPPTNYRTLVHHIPTPYN